MFEYCFNNHTVCYRISFFFNFFYIVELILYIRRRLTMTIKLKYASNVVLFSGNVNLILSRATE